MTALAAGRDTVQIGGPIAPSALVARAFPVAAATTIYFGAMVATDSSGNAVPASASTALKIWGRAEKTVINTVAAGFGSAGDLSIEVMPGVFGQVNGSGVDAITAAHVGRICYASDDNIVNLTDGAGLRPAAGRIEGLYGTQVKVALGEGSLWDISDDIAPVSGFRTLAARNVVTAPVTLASYTVAADQGVNDDTLNVAGDVVLLIAQASAAANGLYVVGAVTTGSAPLTRYSGLPVGAVIDENSVEVKIAEGAKLGGGVLSNSVAVTVGTTDPVFVVRSAPVVNLKTFRVRNVLNANVADLTAYTVASNASNNDATLNVENDLVLLVAQTTAAQNGIYVVGTVGGGTAPLTRLAAMPSGYVCQANEYEIAVAVGTIFGNTKWFNAAGVTIGTTTPQFFPRQVTVSSALTAGTVTIATIPILSATKSGIVLTRRVANTSTNTVGGYCATVGGANGVTAGAIGTAALIIEACVAAGTINNADISTLNITVLN